MTPSSCSKDDNPASYNEQQQQAVVKTPATVKLQPKVSPENTNMQAAVKNPILAEGNPRTEEDQVHSASLDLKVDPADKLVRSKAVDDESNEKAESSNSAEQSPPTSNSSHAESAESAATSPNARIVPKPISLTQEECDRQSKKSLPITEHVTDPVPSGLQHNELESKPAKAGSNTSSSASDSVRSSTNSNLQSMPAAAGPPKVIHTQIPRRRVALPVQSSESIHIPAMVNLPKSKTLRRGKWTVEEESYVARVIQDFNSGFLNAPAGTTLRSYLSEKLQCDPMRITKKFTGDACIGKRVFHPAVRSAGNAAAIDKAQAELDGLERRWRRRLQMQQRESAKKAAASTTAVNAAPQNAGVHLVQGAPVTLLAAPSSLRAAVGHEIQQTVVTQAASWLDRANAILKGSTTGGAGATTSTTYPPTSVNGADTIASNDIESEMNEVRRLIYEGPLIQQTAAGLPNLLTPTSSYVGNDENGANVVGRDQSILLEPADKRQRRAPVSGAEDDAEALVGFLRSVRASAASSGQDISS